MTAQLLGDTAYAAQFDQFSRLYRWEPLREYWSDRERDAFAAGLLPPQVGWWRAALEQMTHWTSPPPHGDGRIVQRVRPDDSEDTAYQAWLRRADRYHRDAGEDLRRMPRALADKLRLPAYDFLVFDDGTLARVVLLLYTAAGKQAQRILIEHADSPKLVEQHLAWRDLTIANATAAVPAVA